MQTTATADTTSDAAVKAYVGGIVNAHALEKQGHTLFGGQVERLKTYPEVEAALRQIIADTEAQLARIEELLAELGSGPSTLKELGTQAIAAAGSLGHAVMPDETMKNHFVNCGFKGIEASTYRSLATMAEATGHQAHVATFEAFMRQEQAAEERLQGMTESLTRDYLSRLAEGEAAKR